MNKENNLKSDSKVVNGVLAGMSLRKLSIPAYCDVLDIIELAYQEGIEEGKKFNEKLKTEEETQVEKSKSNPNYDEGYFKETNAGTVVVCNLLDK